jgi:hypothetical protein
LHLDLCEADQETAKEIYEWKQTLAATSVDIYHGDWRDRFRRGFMSSSAAHVISFDPYMFDRHGPGAAPNLGNMWPSDIIRAGAALLDLGRGPVVVQLSSYSANNANSQSDVIATIEPVFRAAGLELVTTVCADGNMMSMVFCREMQSVGVGQLEQRFHAWLHRATMLA